MTDISKPFRYERCIDVDPATNPVHKLAGQLADALFSLLWEEDYYGDQKPGDDELYNRISVALVIALRKPEIQAEIKRWLGR